jgi:S-formylglutathione hydrolase
MSYDEARKGTAAPESFVIRASSFVIDSSFVLRHSFVIPDPAGQTLSMSSGAWTVTDLDGHAADIFEPTEPHPSGLVVIYLHGVHLARLDDKPVFTRLLGEHGLRVVGPRTGPTWWADRLSDAFDPRRTPERYVLDHVLPFIERQWGAAPPKIGLLGTSMGGQGALRFAFKHPTKFPAVAAIAPAIDYQVRLREGDEVLYAMYRDEEDCRQDTATLHVHPLYWPRHIWFACDSADERWHDSADRLRMKLYSLGIPHECDLRTTAGGHGWPYYEHMAPAAIGFLVRALEKLGSSL